MSSEPVVTNVNEHEKKEEEVKEEEVQTGKSEKKVRKALSKLGMTKIEGVNRVTIRQKDNYILIVKDPEVYSSKEIDNSYIIFGEISMDNKPDFSGQPEVNDLQAEGKKLETENKENVVVEEENTNDTGEGLDPESIDMVIAETSCSKAKAIKALRANNGDVVNSILEINA